jgi:hypothetical protein
MKVEPGEFPDLLIIWHSICLCDDALFVSIFGFQFGSLPS